MPEASPDRVSGSLGDQVTTIEQDPLNQRNDDPERDEDMRTFQEGQKALGTNMAVVMFMVDALQVFSAMEPSKIKEVALEIALLGTQGISPDKKGYKLHHVPGKTFSGYHLLAYYYVSWKLAIPEMLAQLRLPYDGEWALAEEMHKAGA